jgi:hypothetical protein
MLGNQEAGADEEAGEQERHEQEHEGEPALEEATTGCQLDDPR